MALLSRYHLDQATVRELFVYEGTFGGVPVWIGDLKDDSPNIAARNGCPEFLLTVVAFAYETTACMMDWLNIPCRGYPVKIRARLDGTDLDDDPDLDDVEDED